MSVEYLKQLCENNYLNYYMMREIREKHLTLWRNLSPYIEYKDPDVEKYDYYTNILFSFLSGYYINIARKKENSKNFKNWFPKTKTFGGVDRNSFLKGETEYIFYIQLNCMMGQRSFSVCNIITKKQIDVFSRKLGYEISFPTRRKTTIKPEGNPLKKKKSNSPERKKSVRKTSPERKKSVRKTSPERKKSVRKTSPKRKSK